MSEQMKVEGKCTFWHLPIEEKGGFAYCHHCKKLQSSLTIELGEGISADSIMVRCGKCKKAVWTAALTTNKEDYPKAQGGRHIVTEKNKCVGCGTITNRFDCGQYTYKNKKIECTCTECAKKEGEKHE